LLPFREEFHGRIEAARNVLPRRVGPGRDFVMARMTTETSKLILERIRLHPHGSANDIAASLELDGFEVSALQVRRVMKRTQHERQQIQGICGDNPQMPSVRLATA
jgi:hypothetical protein